MKRGIFIALLLLQISTFSYANTENVDVPVIKETYKLQGLIEYDDNRNFEAYEDGFFVHNHSCVSLFEIEIE